MHINPKLDYIFTFTIISICVTICLTLTITTSRMSRTAINNETTQSLIREAECVSNEIHQIVVLRQKQVATLAAASYFSEYSNLNDVQEESFWPVVTTFKGVLQGDGDINRFVIINNNGLGITTEYNPVDLHERLYFKQYKEGKKSEPDCIVSKTSGKQTVMYTTPITNSEGMDIGLLCIGVDAHVFSEIVSKINVGSERPIIIKRDGQFIAHSNADIVMSGANFFALSSCGNIFRNKLTDHTTTCKVTEDDVEKMYAFTPIEGTPWYVGISVREDEANAGYVRMARSNVWVCIGLIILSIIIAFCVGKAIGQPIDVISNAIDSLSKGNIKAVLHKRKLRSKELTRLNDAYCDLVDMLTTLTNEIKAASQNLQASAENVKDASARMASDANEQAEATREIANTVDEIANNISQNANNARQTE